jgi:hypothetical protein
MIRHLRPLAAERQRREALGSLARRRRRDPSSPDEAELTMQ